MPIRDALPGATIIPYARFASYGRLPISHHATPRRQSAPDLVPALAATIGDLTALGRINALRAAIDLYQRLRRESPDIERRTGAESAVLSYFEDIEARLARDGLLERRTL